MRIGLRARVAAVSAAVLCATAGATAPIQTAHAAPSYPNGFIAIGLGSEPNGWTMATTDGTHQHLITPTGGGYNSALAIQTLRYSPDAKQAAFVVMDKGSLKVTVWVSAADGSGAHRIADVQYVSTPVAWSPDSKTVYYQSSGFMTAIKAARADGSGEGVAAFNDSPSCTDNGQQTTTRGYIFFFHYCAGQDPASSWAIYRPGDAAPVNVQISGPSDQVRISPDGTRIAMIDRQDGRSRIVVKAVGDSAAARQVTSVPDQDYIEHLDFAPSGEIVFNDLQPAADGWRSVVKVVADQPNATPRTVMSFLQDSSLSFVTWVNGPAAFGSRPTVDRIGGTDRVDTAVKASQWSYDNRDAPGRRAASAVLARADLFPDALAGTALAVQSDGPLLLTPGRGLDRAVATELQRILAPGSTVYILGGTSALSPAVASQVQQLGFHPVRLGGPNRFATAVAIAQVIPGEPKSVLVATGEDFPDALTAGVAAAQERYSARGPGLVGGGVVVLTDGTTMPPETRDYLASVRVPGQTVYAVGGQAVSAVAQAFPERIGEPDVVSLAGADRFQTAALVAGSTLFGSAAPGRVTMAGIATGLNFPDAMSGGALIGNQGGPLLLTDVGGLPPSERAVMTRTHLTGVTLFGGSAAIPPGVLADTGDIAFGPHAWDGFVNRRAPALP